MFTRTLSQVPKVLRIVNISVRQYSITQQTPLLRKYDSVCVCIPKIQQDFILKRNYAKGKDKKKEKGKRNLAIYH